MLPDREHREDFVAGARDISPTLLGTGPYGLVMGIAAADAGLTLTQATGLSTAVFAGVSQLIAVDLIGHASPVWLVILTALIVNMRFMMYSASIAPYLSHLTSTWRWATSFFLIGPVYAVSLAAFDFEKPTHNGWYVLGAGVPSWILWIAGTIVGMLIGVQIPDTLHLDFVIPLVFIAITMNFITDYPTVIAAATGGGVAILAMGVPLNLGIVIAGLLGILAGLLVERWSS